MLRYRTILEGRKHLLIGMKKSFKSWTENKASTAWRKYTIMPMLKYVRVKYIIRETNCGFHYQNVISVSSYDTSLLQMHIPLVKTFSPTKISLQIIIAQRTVGMITHVQCISKLATKRIQVQYDVERCERLILNKHYECNFCVMVFNTLISLRSIFNIKYFSFPAGMKNV